MKKQKLFTLAISFFFAIPCICAQDIITLKSGDEIKAKVVEISSTEIKYKRFDNLNGPTVVITKADVFTIKYENGTKEVISPVTAQQPIVQPATTAIAKTPATSYVPEKTNSIGIYANPMGFLTFGPMVGAEFTFNKFILETNLRFPSLGLLVPVAISSEYDNTVDDGLGIGFGAKFYNAKPRGGFYIGGFVEYWYHNYTYTEINYYGNESGIVFAANIGYKFQFQSGLYLRTGGYLGATVLTVSDEYGPSSYTDYSGDSYVFGLLDLALGFRF